MWRVVGRVGNEFVWKEFVLFCFESVIRESINQQWRSKYIKT